MTTAYRKIVTGVLALSASTLALSTAAYAQLDEIIVTATKKEESLQDVSMSIAAFDTEALEAYRIDGLEDIAQFTPGLFSYPAAANPTGLRISLRGVGTFDPQLGLDSKVAVYTDGIYLGKTVGLAFDSPDLERVEVLKGPQGTLYGRNAVAGAINLISARPDSSNTFGHIEAEYGNYNAIGLSGHANFGFADKAALRISGQFDSRDGWVENTGVGSDWSGYSRFGVRGAFGLEFSPEVYMELSADYNESENDSHFYQSATNACSIPANALCFSSTVVGAADGRLDSYAGFSDTEPGTVVNSGVSAKLEYDFSENHMFKVLASWRGLDSERGVSLNPQSDPQALEAMFNSPAALPALQGQSMNNILSTFPALVAASGTGASIRSDYFNNIPRSPIGGLFQTPPGGTAPSVDGHSQFSLEGTFSGSFNNDRLEYTAGLFYFDEKTSTGRASFNGTDGQDYLDLFAPAAAFGAAGTNCLAIAGGGAHSYGCNAILPNSVVSGTPFFAANLIPIGVVSPTLSRYAISPAAPGFLLPSLGGALAQSNAVPLVDTLRSSVFSTGNILGIDTQSYAAYGQMTFHVNDALRLIGGLRYSKEEKTGTQQNQSAFFRDFLNLLGEPIVPQTGDISFDSLDPQAIIEYDVSDDMMVYASYSQAFRSGGFNASASLPAVAPATVGTDFVFQPEEIKSYEAGFKGDFADNRFRLNAAGFYYDIPNEQTTVGINPLISTQRAIVNVKTKVWGAEGDLTAAITDELTARGSLSWIDGDPGFPVNPVTGAVISRQQLQGSPELSYTASLHYDGEMDNGMNLFGNVAYSHTDEVESTPNLFFGERDLVSGRVGIRLKNGATVALWGQNLFDDEYTVDKLPFETFINEVQVFGTPRTFGITAGMDF